MTLNYVKLIYIYKNSLMSDQFSILIFTPQPLRAPGYCGRPSGRAGGRADKPR